MPIWPFKRRFTGLVDGVSVPTAADLEALDEQVSRAANGLLWSDVALFRNFTAIAMSAHVPIIGYDPYGGNWFGFGLPYPSGTLNCRRSVDDAATWDVLTSTTSGSTYIPRQLAFDGAGVCMLSYTPAVPSTTKCVYSTDEFATVTGVVTGASTASGGDIAYSKLLSLWFLALDDGALYSASTPSGTWTQRLAPGSGATKVVDGADRITTGTKYSFDGITFVNATRPGTTGLVHFLPTQGLFVFQSGGPIYSSPDYINWTTVNASPPASVRGAYGRVLLGYGSIAGGVKDLLYSLDAGANWKRARMGKLPASEESVFIAMGADRALISVNILADSTYYRGSAAGF